MRKDDCERAIRYLCTEWARERGIPRPPVNQPSFSDFKSWLANKGYGQYLNFKSVRGPESDAEDWFDQELKQTWRN
jgi:hypothetical protein